MTNKNVFEIIERLADTSKKEFVYTSSEVFCAIAHGYCYIKPGKDTGKFLEKIDRIFNDAQKGKGQMYCKMKTGIPYEEWLCGKMASEAVAVMRSMFNKSTYNYFKEAMKKDMNHSYDDELLEHYLYFLEMKDLKTVVEGIIAFKENNNFFISDEKYKLMMEEFEECSIYVAEQEAKDSDDLKEHIEYINSYPLSFFNYLCREDIIDIIYRHIDVDPIMLANMIKAYVYTESTNTAAEYTAIAAEAMYNYDIDVFDPHLTDKDVIKFDNITPKKGRA